MEFLKSCNALEQRLLVVMQDHINKSSLSEVEANKTCSLVLSILAAKYSLIPDKDEYLKYMSSIYDSARSEDG